MQKDLDIIFKWAEEIVMEYNEETFKQLSYGTNSNVTMTPY